MEKLGQGGQTGTGSDGTSLGYTWLSGHFVIAEK